MIGRRWGGRTVLVALFASALAFGAAGRAAGQERYALLVEGASGEPQYATLHRGWLDALHGLLVDRFKMNAANIVVLADKPVEGESRATADNLRAEVAKLVPRVKADDQLFVFLIGHGTASAGEAKFNLIGPDLSAAEWKDLLAPVTGTLVFVNTTSASFPYLAGLSGPKHVVITATRTAAEKFHTQFADAFIKALAAPEADADKNARISMLEAFTYASQLVAQGYEREDAMATEHAVLDDNGDGQGRVAADAGDDGAIAGMTYLDAEVLPTSSDPEVQALIKRQADLTRQIDDLRRRRASMPPIAFDQQFEPLIIELATVSREVRRRTGGQVLDRSLDPR
ncbi:MAG: hypothetical protein R2752_14660 [Vicinamibacterales bacterium]